MAVTFHVVQRMAPGGIESIVLDLARRDADIRVISLEGCVRDLTAQWPQLLELGDRLTALAKPDGLRPMLWPRLVRLFWREQPHTVITHHIGPFVYAGLAARLARITRRIHVEHDGWHYAGARRRLLAKILDRLVAPRRVAVSSVTADQVATALGTIRQTVIPNGVNLDRFLPADRQKARRLYGLPLNAFLIGSVGRLVPVKGHDLLIEAMAELAMDTHLVLAGDGSERAALNDKVRQLGLQGRVTFLGNITEPETLYPAFDLFCLPSRAEGFPRAIIEAQACDIPVVAADVGGVREGLCPATGYLVPPEAPLAMARAIVTYRAERGSGSPRAFVNPAFSNDVMIERYQALAIQ